MYCRTWSDLQQLGIAKKKKTKKKKHTMWWCSRANVTTDTLGRDREVILDSCTAGMSSMQSTKNVQSRPLDDFVKKKKGGRAFLTFTCILSLTIDYAHGVWIPHFIWARWIWIIVHFIVFFITRLSWPVIHHYISKRFTGSTTFEKKKF